MNENKENTVVLGKENGRKLGFEGNSEVHRSQWMPASHPGTNEIPYLLYPTSISVEENSYIRYIWRSSDYSGKNFAPFELAEVPNKYKLGQILACGIKATCATYSQHWQGMYFDWTFNSQCKEAISKLKVLSADETFSENAFATVVLINTGYQGVFMDLLTLRRRPIPPSIYSLEHIDMGTFENNLKSAVGAVLGGHIGVNVIRRSLAKDLVEGPNKEAYDMLKKLVTVPGMDENGKIVTIVQLGFKQPQDREMFDPEVMKMAGAKLIERKSERRNADFTLEVPDEVMFRFVKTFNETLKKFGVRDVTKMVVVEGNHWEGHLLLARIRDRIKKGMDKAHTEVIKAYEKNLNNSTFTFSDFEAYKQTADMIAELGNKVLKPREDGHKMVFIAIDMAELKQHRIAIDVAEQAVGEAIQAGLNSVHLDATTNIPEGEDLRLGAFCMTGPMHSAELLDTDEDLARGWGKGFCDVLSPSIQPTDKMEAVIAICAKREQDALIAEKQAMDHRKSVNDLFWYRTWNHPEGKRLDLPHWISFADVLNVLPIEGNDVILREKDLPDYLPDEHPITSKIMSRN